MKIDNIDDAVIEAKRFIHAASLLKFKTAKDGIVESGRPCAYCKESSALRRSSMDLTRALAKLRREQY